MGGGESFSKSLLVFGGSVSETKALPAGSAGSGVGGSFSKSLLVFGGSVSETKPPLPGGSF